MPTKTAIIAAAAVTLSFSGAYATLIDFEDLPAGTFVQQGYKGFAWTGSQGVNSWINNGANGVPNYANHSGSSSTWSNGASALTMSGSLFTLNSVWLATSGATITELIHGYNAGTEIFSRSVSISGAYQLVSLNFTGITSVTFDNPGTNLRVDDITINQTPVPEGGSTFALLGLTMAGVAGVRRRIGI